MSLYLGIDFGTSTIFVTKWNEARLKAEPVPNLDPQMYGKGQLAFPNVIYYQPNGEPVIGSAAYTKYKSDPENGVYAVKRLIGTSRWEKEIPNLQEKVTAPRVIRDIFSTLRDKIIKNCGGQQIDGVVISVPYAFLNYERTILRKAAEAAGLNVIGLIEEPVAAALSYGLFNETNNQNSENQKVLIFDLGGGTFDVTIFAFSKNNDIFNIEVLNTAGEKSLGGNDVDEVLKNYIIETTLQIPLENRSPKYQNKVLGLAKEAKEELSQSDTAGTIYEADAYNGEELDGETITRDLFEDLLKSNFMSKIMDALDESIYEVDLEREDIDQIILVGGSSNIPLIHAELLEYFGKEAVKTDKPEELVGEGAGIYCGLLLNKNLKLHVVQRNSHAIGIKDGVKFSPILPKNSPYNVYSDIAYFSVAGSDTINIDVYQGNSRHIEKCSLIGHIQSDGNLYPDRRMGMKLGTNAGGEIIYQLYNSNGQIVDQATL